MAASAKIMPALAAGACDDVEEVSAQLETTTFCIRNTFIDVSDGVMAHPPRRSASAPPTVRRTHSDLADDVADGSNPSDEPTGMRPSKSMCWSTASTSANGDEDAEVASFEEDSMSSTSGKSPRGARGVQLSLLELVPQPQRAALNKAAKMWTPGQQRAGSADCKLCQPPAVRSQLADVFVAAYTALTSCKAIQHVSVSENVHGWTLVGSAHPKFSQDAKLAMANAQKSMLTAAEESKAVYVIGYEAAPFAASSCGLTCTAQLAVLEHEDSVCWNHVKTGFCQWGRSCRRKHQVHALVRCELRFL